MLQESSQGWVSASSDLWNVCAFTQIHGSLRGEGSVLGAVGWGAQWELCVNFSPEQITPRSSFQLVKASPAAPMPDPLEV